MKTVLQQDSVNVLKALPSSNDSIRRKMDEMSSDVESLLVEISKTTKPVNFQFNKTSQQ